MSGAPGTGTGTGSGIGNRESGIGNRESGIGNRHGACREALLLAGRQDARPVARLTGPLVGEAACAQRG
ncbi:hypothetical protein BMAJHU_B0167 [Burkholderia mallei JHU]|nr:hypothetical protein BMAJHU_B0167 [Burkholderia mallei JHU]